jgi:hypothetical protein
MVKLHLFTGFENEALGITADMELGHLYEDTNSIAILAYAAEKVGLKASYKQDSDGLFHFDLWGKPLERAKRMFPVISDQTLHQDMIRIKREAKYEKEASP